MSVLLEKFLVKNNYTHVSKKDISQQLQTHPQNPSFRAITDTLDYFGIENIAANVPEDSLPSMPSYFLTIINQNEDKLVLVTKKENLIQTIDESGNKEKYTFSGFSKIWGKTIIAIEETTKKESQSQLIRRSGLLLAPIIIITYLLIKDTIWITSLILLLSSIGLYISLLLVKEKIGYHSPSVHSICTSTANTNCEEVINSKGGMLFKNISLADASFLYFSILIFNIIFFEYNNITSLFILSSIPVIVFSIYYQSIIIKKWCPLCLGVVVVLISINVLIFRDLSFNFTISQSIEFFLILATLIPPYFFIKNIIISNKKNEEDLIVARRFKRNPNIIKNFMKNVKVIDDLNMMENEIRLGNPKATHKIIVFTNPFCGFCKKAFESYLKILNLNTEVEIWIRFNSQVENLDSSASKISARLIEIYFEEGQQNFINAYTDWFKNKDDKNWLKNYNNPIFEEKTILLLKKHRQWAAENSISYTPATIIQGEEFPSTYGYEDLPHAIGDIFELQTEKKKLSIT